MAGEREVRAQISRARGGFGQGVRKSARAADDLNVQHSLSKRFGRATDAMRVGAAVARNREVDVETGLRTRAYLFADLARLHSSAIPARLELLALNAGDGLDDALLTNTDAELPRRIGDALREATEPSGARAYRIDSSLYAFLGPVDSSALTPAATAHSALSAISERLAAGAVRGEARIPDEASDGPGALAIAHERLKARSRWQRLSSERQVRDVLLQILSERRAGGSIGSRASPPSRSGSDAASASRSASSTTSSAPPSCRTSGCSRSPSRCCASAPRSSPRSGR